MKSGVELVALGLNHRTAPVEIREKFCLAPEVIKKGLEKLVRKIEELIQISEGTE